MLKDVFPVAIFLMAVVFFWMGPGSWKKCPICKKSYSRKNKYICPEHGAIKDKKEL